MPTAIPPRQPARITSSTAAPITNEGAAQQAAAAAITHHRCDPDAAIARLQDRGSALDSDPPAALHLLAGLWVASCPTCGFQLASAASQARAERRSRRRTCPVCHEVA